MKSKLKVAIPIIFLAINFLFVILSFKSSPFSNVLNEHDSTMFMYFGKAMNNGMTPYIDMFDHKGIVLFWIQQIGVFIGFGNFSTGIWIIEILFYLVTLVFLYKTCIAITENKIASSFSIMLLTGAMIIPFSGGNYSEEFALSFIAIAGYLFTKILVHDKQSKVSLVLIGITGALTFFIRSNMVALWLVFCIYFIFESFREKNFKLLFERALYIFVGGILVCSVIVIYSIIHNNFHEMIYQTFVLNAQYSSGNSTIEKISTAKSFLEFSSRIGIIPLIALTTIYLVLNKDNINSKKFTYFMVMYIYLLINFVTVIISGRYYNHYYVTMIFPVVVISVIGIHGFLSFIKNNIRRSIFLLALCSLTMSYSYLSLRDLVKNPLTTSPDQKVESLTINQAEYIEAHSKQTDSIYIHNIDANIYLYSNRYSNSKYFVLPSLDYTEFRHLKNEFLDDMKSNPPKFIVLRKETFEKNSDTDVRINLSLKKIINENYKIVPKYKNTEYLMFEKTNY